MTVVVVGTALIGCIGSDGARYYALGDGLPTLMFGEGTAEPAETQLCDWLAYVHMDSADADCLVAKVKASRYWRANPTSFSVPPEEANEFARDCGIDLTELYTVSHGD